MDPLAQFVLIWAPVHVRRFAYRALLLFLALRFAASPGFAKSFELETASIADIQAAVAAGALSYEKLMMLCLARINAYDVAGPKLHALITVNPNAVAEAKALDAERQATGLRSPLHGIPVIVKDNYDTKDLPTTAGSVLLAGSLPPNDAFLIKRLHAAGAIILAKANLDEFASGGPGTYSGFSSYGGQTHNPHNPLYAPGGSSGGSGVSAAAWYVPLALGTDSGRSIRAPCSYNGIAGIRPSIGLLSRTGIIPLVHSTDTGGPMARNIYDVAVALGVLAGVDPADPVTRDSLDLAYHDYTPFLKKDALKGVRLGINRNYTARNTPDVNRVLDAAIGELKAAGAIIVDPVNFPSQVMNVKDDLIRILDYTEFREQIGRYLSGLTQPGYPKTLTEMIERADRFQPDGHSERNPGVWATFKLQNASPSSQSLAYRSAKVHGVGMVRDAVLGVFEEYRIDAMVYPTWPSPAPVITESGPPAPSSAPALTYVASLTGFPDVIVPAGFTRKEKLPITISFFGPAFSEPKLLAYAYAYEQATHHRISPATTPSLPGEKFEY